MHIRLIVIGKLKNAALRTLQDDYAQRIGRTTHLELIELKDSNVRDEGIRIIKSLERTKVERSYALTEEGKTYSSPSFSKLIDRDYAGTINLIIGGPYGLDKSVKTHCNATLSLSPMTFTHEFARVIVLEQIYRALEIQRGSGYHH